MDAETKARFEALTKTSGEHNQRFDKIDSTLVKVNKSLTDIQVKLASRDSWNWIVKALVLSLIGLTFYFFRGKIGA